MSKTFLFSLFWRLYLGRRKGLDTVHSLLPTSASSCSSSQFSQIPPACNSMKKKQPLDEWCPWFWGVKNSSIERRKNPWREFWCWMVFEPLRENHLQPWKHSFFWVSGLKGKYQVFFSSNIIQLFWAWLINYFSHTHMCIYVHTCGYHHACSWQSQQCFLSWFELLSPFFSPGTLVSCHSFSLSHTFSSSLDSLLY